MTEEKESIVQPAVVVEPKVGSCYSNGWRKLWKYFLELFLIIIIAFIFSLPAGIGGFEPKFGIWDVLAISYGVLILGPIEYGVAFAFLKAARGNGLKIKDIFEPFQNYWNAVLANVLVDVIIFIGFILLIIPGIIFACKLVFTPYLVVDRRMEVIEAVKESWRISGGYAWKVFFIYLIAIPVGIAGLICFGVGIVIAIMWVSLTVASLYYAISVARQSGESA